MLTLASASGNAFAYGWEDELPADFDGPAWARSLCPRGVGLGLDGIFRLSRPVQGAPWVLEHWDADGARTFCSNGTRAALALPGAPAGTRVEALSSGTSVLLGRGEDCFALRMPSGEGFGFRKSPLALGALEPPQPHACAWIGNPQLIVEMPGVRGVDLPRFAVPLRHHPAFEGGTNVSILEVVSPGQARIRTWERGVEGETLCCGTACAVAAAWLCQRTGIRHWELVPTGGDPVTVAVDLHPDGDWSELWLWGPARLLGTFQPAPEQLPRPLNLP